MKSEFTRRAFLRSAGVGGAAAALAGCGVSMTGARTIASPGRAGKRALRVAHLTDAHVTPDRDAPAGIAACLQHVHALKDRPDVILTGGDCIMDALNAPEPSVRDQWAVWTRAFADHCSIPAHHCLGNHDIWG